MIKVSFIVIGYNVESYIERALKSILNQSMKEIEVIFVNDGSTDNTEKIVRKIIAIDSRVNIVNQKNMGANAARKTGYKASKGEFIVFVDGDDWIEVELGKNLYDNSIQQNSDIIAFGHYIAVDIKHKYKSEIGRVGILKDYEYLNLILSGQISHNLWNKFLKKEFLEKCKFNEIPNITMGDDLAANTRFGIYNPKVIIVNEYYYNYFQNTKSVTKITSPKMLEMEETIKDIEKNLKEKNLLKKYKKHIEFIKFRNFYARVVKSKSTENDVIKRLYRNWKEANIDFLDNEYCRKYMKSKSAFENILMHMYNFNFKLGYTFSRVYLKIIKNKV